MVSLAWHGSALRVNNSITCFPMHCIYCNGKVLCYIENNVVYTLRNVGLNWWVTKRACSDKKQSHSAGNLSLHILTSEPVEVQSWQATLHNCKSSTWPGPLLTSHSSWLPTIPVETRDRLSLLAVSRSLATQGDRTFSVQGPWLIQSAITGWQNKIFSVPCRSWVNGPNLELFE